MVLYGQVAAGPPGAGKTTYCTGMQEYLRYLGRNALVINLDPANEVPKTKTSAEGGTEPVENENDLPYEVLLDVCECVVNLSSVMKQLGLGPNGGLVYCMEYLEAHVDKIVAMIEERIRNEDEDVYLIFDLPGQVELYTHGNAVPRLLSKLVKILDLRLVAVQLIDSHYCTEPSNFLSAALLGTTVMLKLELPTVNVLSKVDLLASYGPLPFSLEFFTDCQDLNRLVPFLHQGHDDTTTNNDDAKYSSVSSTELYDEDSYADDPEYQLARKVKLSSPFFRRHERLHKAMAEVVDEFGLIAFLPLDISNAESVGRILSRIDKCNGYVFKQHSAHSTHENINASNVFQAAANQADPSNREIIADVQERVSLERDEKHYEKKEVG